VFAILALIDAMKRGTLIEIIDSLDNLSLTIGFWGGVRSQIFCFLVDRYD